MSEIENPMGAQLRSLDPFVPVEADWTDVMARVSLSEGRRLRVKRRRFVYAFAAIIAVAALVLPPIGLGGRLLDFFGVTAPEPIQRFIGQETSPREAVVKWLNSESHFDVDPSTSRGIMQVESEQGPIRLWGASSKDGKTRFRFVQWPNYHPNGAGSVGGVFTGLGTGVGGPKLDAAIELPETTWPGLEGPLLHGQLLPPATGARVRYADGKIQTLSVVDGYLLAKLVQTEGSATVEALDRLGAIVGKQELSLDPPKPQVILETRRLMDVDFPNGTASLFVKPEAHDPKRCYRVTSTNGSTGGCGTNGGSVGYGVQQVGDVDPTLLLIGAAATDVTRMRIKLPDGWHKVDLREGYFLIPLSKAQRPSSFELIHKDGTKEIVPIKFG